MRAERACSLCRAEQLYGVTLHKVRAERACSLCRAEQRHEVTLHKVRAERACSLCRAKQRHEVTSPTHLAEGPVFLRAWGESGVGLGFRLMRLFHILFFHISEKLCIFAADLVTQRTGSFLCKGVRICALCVKRESGESPEQSRCCKLLIPQLSSGGPPRMM